MMNTTMQAVRVTEYGGPEVLKVETFKKPAPKPNQILVRNHAAAVTAADTFLRMGTPRVGRLFLGLRRPKNPIPGTGFAGVVEAVGSEVTDYLPGDRVCGESLFGFSSYAEYLVVEQDAVITHMPELMSYDEGAVFCDGAVTSWNFIRDVANMKSDQRLMIIGASGALGTAAIQIGKEMDLHVTAVCSSANAELVTSLGADAFIDYKTTDYTKLNERFDVIYDTVGKSSFRACKAILKEQGQYVCPVLKGELFVDMFFRSQKHGKKAKFAATGTRKVVELRAMLLELMEMYRNREIRMVMDRTYAMNEVVQAHQYVDSGRKRGNIVLSMEL